MAQISLRGRERPRTRIRVATHPANTHSQFQTMEFLTRLFPQVRQLQRDAIRIRSEREEWRQRYTSLKARTQQADSAAEFADEAEWRNRIALWSAEQARALPGDFV